jgi:uncharacterized membrane protein
MSSYTIHLSALLIGVVAGLRTFTAPAAVSWAARLGAVALAGTPLAFLGSDIALWLLTVMAIVEFVVDQRPGTASRKTPVQFTARIVSGAVCGAAMAAMNGRWLVGLIVGIIGAILGTLLGFTFREDLARAFHEDRPAAFLEDAVAIAGAVLIVAGVLG